MISEDNDTGHALMDVMNRSELHGLDHWFSELTNLLGRTSEHHWDFPTTAQEKDANAGVKTLTMNAQYIIDLRIEPNVLWVCQLLRLSTAARWELGSSANTTRTVDDLVKLLHTLRGLLFGNANMLYPRHSQLHWPELHDNQRTVIMSNFPLCFAMLQGRLSIFLKCLNDFPEFKGDLVEREIGSLNVNLAYWVSRLEVFKDRLEERPVRLYLNDIGCEIGMRAKTIGDSVHQFIEIGVPAIDSAQKHGSRNLASISTIATLFSGVSGAALAISFQQNTTELENTVNGFWFISLVFSIAAAVNSVLGLTWIHHADRLPISRIPWFITFWYQTSPLIFLTCSVACFDLGLVLFSYASNQHIIVSIMVTSLTAFTGVGLYFAASWYILELGVARYGKGTWIYDFLWGNKPTEGIVDDMSLFEDTQVQGRQERPENLFRSFKMLFDEMKAAYIRESRLPAISSNGVTSQITSPVRAPIHHAVKVIPRMTKLLKIDIIFSNDLHSGLLRHAQFSPDGQFLATAGWDGRVCLLHRIAIDHEHAKWARLHEYDLDIQCPTQIIWPKSGNNFLVRLPTMVQIGCKAADGKWSTNLGRSIDCGGYVDDVISTSSSSYGNAGAEDFLYVSNGKLTLMEYMEGKHARIVDTGPFYTNEDTKIQDVAVVPETTNIVYSGYVSRAVQQMHAEKYRKDMNIAVYNLYTANVEHIIPVFSIVRDISVSQRKGTGKRGGEYRWDVLISYEGQVFPQLWQLSEEIGSGVSKGLRLSFRHAYRLEPPVHFSSPAYFGGTNDDIVFCASKEGELYVWDTNTGSILHRATQFPEPRDLTCIACHEYDGSFAFATGTPTGTVHIWAKPDEK